MGRYQLYHRFSLDAFQFVMSAATRGPTQNKPGDSLGPTAAVMAAGPGQHFALNTWDRITGPRLQAVRESWHTTVTPGREGGAAGATGPTWHRAGLWQSTAGRSQCTMQGGHWTGLPGGRAPESMAPKSLAEGCLHLPARACGSCRRSCSGDRHSQ